MLKKEKSEALTKEFNKYFPGGHSNLRIPMDVTEHRLFISKSDGTHLTDVDGNEYIEYNWKVENIIQKSLQLFHFWTNTKKKYIILLKKYVCDTGGSKDVYLKRIIQTNGFLLMSF